MGNDREAYATSMPLFAVQTVALQKRFGNNQRRNFDGSISRRKGNKISPLFSAAVVFIFASEYCFFTLYSILPLLWPQVTLQGIILCVVFHLLYALTVINYIQCLRTDPGAIPQHWAFHRGDFAKRRRYCKECNVWKPDRTHHCSVCARCVLNMDHHCPWIGGCVGFYNRKFFLLLLAYGVVSLGLVFICGSLQVIWIIWTRSLSISSNSRPSVFYDLGLVAIGVVMELMTGFLFLMMFQFALFHFRLASSNLTTIENLDYDARETAIYDLGAQKNLMQILGPSILLWWLPAHTALTAPVGDGVRWHVANKASQWRQDTSPKSFASSRLASGGH